MLANRKSSKTENCSVCLSQGKFCCNDGVDCTADQKSLPPKEFLFCNYSTTPYQCTTICQQINSSHQYL